MDWSMGTIAALALGAAMLAAKLWLFRRAAREGPAGEAMESGGDVSGWGTGGR